MNIYEQSQDNADDTVELTVEQYQEYKSTYESIINDAKSAQKLSENPDFIKIVMEAYFENEPKRLAGLMATGRLSEKQFNECAEDLKSIGSLRTFLQAFIQKGNIAHDELKNLEEAWNESVAANGTIYNGGGE